MRTVQITTVCDPKGKNKRQIVLPFNEPTTLAEAAKVFGEQTILDKAIDALRVAFQATMRNALMPDKDGKKASEAEIKTKMAGWKPGNRKAADPKKRAEAVSKSVAKMTPAEKAALLKQLQG